MIKKSLFAFIGIELIHYCYLLYKLNFNKNEKNKITDKNIKKVLNTDIALYYLKKNNFSNNFELESIYNHFLQDWPNHNNFSIKLINPLLLINRIYYTNSFLYYLVKLKYLGFEINITSNSIFILRIKNNFNKLILFHPGILGNIHHIYNLICNLDQSCSIIISIFRSNLNTLFWTQANFFEHIKHLDKLVKYFKTIIPVTHSFGSFVIESLYNYNKSIELKVHKEILIQPANILSTGLIFLSSLIYNYFSYINFISNYSKKYVHNLFFSYTVKTLAGISSLESIENLSGFRFKSKKISGYIILSDSDPLINLHSYHPFSDELNHIFKNHQIIVNKGYHGFCDKNQSDVLVCLQECL